MFWSLPYTPSADARPCCGRANRGLAILGNTLYMGNSGCWICSAIDARTGKLLWNIEVAKAADRYVFTHAPLVVKDKILMGTAGGDGPIRGFIAAFDAKTGKEVWRVYTIPGAGEPGNDTWSGESWKIGGVGLWNTPSYDPETNLTFWGTGDSIAGLDRCDPSRRQPVQRKYACARCRHRKDEVVLPVHTARRNGLRLHAGCGACRYGVAGTTTKSPLFANRNGLMYVLDRTTGQFLKGWPFVTVNWMDGFDEKGRPKRVPGYGADSRRRHHQTNRAWGDELVSAVLQSEDRFVLRFVMGKHRHDRRWQLPPRNRRHAHGQTLRWRQT